MKNKFIAIVITLIIFSGTGFAFRPSIIGGIRKGAAIGVYADQHLDGRLYLHTGIEANTSTSPLIGILGASIYLSRIANRYPLLMNLGLVLYSGNKTEAGLNLSFAFERFLDVKNLFIETGIDVVGSGGILLLQLGYKL